MAQEEGNDEAEMQILGIIKREKEWAFWHWLQYSMPSKSEGSVSLVQVEDDEGNIEVFS